MRCLLPIVLLACTLTASGQGIFFGNGSSGSGNPYTELANIDDITTQGSPGWSLCDAGCAGGGDQAPTSWVQTFGVTTQSKDGHSMSLAMIAQAQGSGTNALETYKIGHNPTADTLTHFVSDQWFYGDTNWGTYALQTEFDDALFCSTCTDGGAFPNGINYMFGFQCDLTRSGGVIEVWNQATGTWVTATYSGGNIPCTTSGFAAPNTWHHLQKTEHLVSGDYSSCSGAYPTMHYDNITLDGVPYTPTNTNTCAGPLHAGWNSVWLTQMQFNIGSSGSSGNTATVYYDLTNFFYY
jgi:hypothetical protein